MSLFPSSNVKDEKPGFVSAVSSWDPGKLFRQAESDASGEIVAGARKIYILPTRFGLMFGCLVLAMLLGSINYANNLGYLLTFFLASIGVLVMHQTWYNLLNLKIRLLPVEPVFAGQSVSLKAQIHNAYNRQRGSILFYQREQGVIAEHDIDANQMQIFELNLKSSNRGWFIPRKLILASQYPLGLFHAWVYIKTDIRTLVFAKPSAAWAVPSTLVYSLSSQGSKGIGADDFVAHRNYRVSDSPKQIDWKIYAREKGLMTKQFGGDRSERLWLSFDLIENEPLEVAISKLTRAVIDAEKSGVDYGLKLPGVSTSLGQGHEHYFQCLKHLALFKWEANSKTNRQSLT